MPNLFTRVFWAFIVLFVYSRCTAEQIVDHRLKPFLDSFIEDAKRYGVDVNESLLSSLEYGDISGPLMEDAIGVCLPLVTGPASFSLPRSSRIIIEPAYPYNSCSFKALVYHELAHCLLYESHSERFTLMSPFMENNEKFYCQNWESLLEELFTGKETPKIIFHEEGRLEVPYR